VRLAPVAELLADGWLAEAQLVLEARGDEPALAAAVRVLAALVEGGSPDGAGVEHAVKEIVKIGPATVAWATRCGLSVVAARRLEEDGQWVAASRCWEQARRPVDEERALRTAVTSRHMTGMACVLLGNLLRDRDGPAARLAYREAFLLDAENVSVEDILDPLVRSTVEEAGSWVPLPTGPWVPVVGHAMGLWPFPHDLTKGDATEPARFLAALLASRTGTARGRPDVDARREMKRLAPKLFAYLMEEGML
jgi:hypothetical protein